MNINEWYAKQCGVLTSPKVWGYYDDENLISILDEWTIEDSRCREIIREKFGLTTVKANDTWLCMFHRKDKDPITRHGKSLPEAEIKCLKAIYEVRQDDE